MVDSGRLLLIDLLCGLGKRKGKDGKSLSLGNMKGKWTSEEDEKREIK